MRYFTYIAEQSFKTTPNGQRLFCRFGPWSRPYVIPDADTERRIYWKLVWMYRITLGGLLVVGPLFLFAGRQNPMHSIGSIVALIALFYFALHVLLAPELKGLDRMPARLSLQAFYGEAAEKHSTRALALGFGGSLIFVMAGVWLLASGESAEMPVLAIGFFGLCAIVWGYALFLKRRKSSS